MIKTAVILAAGKGNRLNKITNYKSKPLTELFGRTFIDRAILNLRNNLKVENFIIVTGHNNQESEQYLDQLKQKYNLNLSCIYDPDWEKGNGHTFLAALNNTNEDQFYLQMVDHLFTDKFYQVILNTKISNNKSYLLVSKNLSKYHDYGDVTKVKIENNYINNLDKSIEKPNAYDAGFFIIDKKNYDTNIFFNFDKVELSKVHMSVADKQNLLPIYVEHSDWMDIDTEVDLKKAEDFLIESLKNKSTDGPVSKYINRKLSVPISKKLINYDITPNQISIGVFLIAVLGAFIIAQDNYFALLFGALLAQLSSVLDGCDGEIARLKLLKSKFGGWFDQVLDRYSDIFILSGLTIHCFNNYETTWVIIIGLLAVGTKTLLSYTAYKYDEIFKNNNSFRIGRDVTTLILFVGAILNFPYFTLILLAVLFNFEILKRIYLLKDRLI